MHTTSSIFALYIISATKFVSCSSVFTTGRIFRPISRVMGVINEFGFR